ncbi:MAG TPA: sensor domain-containing diguanylate cyclase [Ruminiclostridium sp.]
MDKIQKYEKALINLCWVFIVLLITSIVITMKFNINTNVIIKQGIMINIFIVALVIFNVIKTKFVNNAQMYSDKVFDVFRLIEVVLISFFLIGFSEGIEYLVLIFPLVFSTLYRGRKTSLILLSLSAVIKVGYFFIGYFLLNLKDINNLNVLYVCFQMIWFYIILITTINISTKLYKGNVNNEKENERLVIELGEKYEQLETARNEIKNQYDKLINSNQKLEHTNRCLTSSIAEFYTLQQISEAIGSIFDTNELLKFVNDVFLGVMGVNYSTIVLFDPNGNRLQVQFTNIKNKEDLAILSDNVNCKILINILENEKPILENMVDHDKYDFIKTRNVGSFICIPLSSKSRKFGLTLIEHKNNNTFNDDNLRLLTTIGKQVSMAIENAELYANLQEMATIDGLTGVFNRVYFHQKYESEFNMARELGYDLSLVILDIDLFKKFNDTYGHMFGDIVLKSVAQTVKNNLRGTDTIARFGGEEFVLILPRTSIQEAFEKVELLRHKIANNVVYDNGISASVTASFGIACFRETSKNQIELIRDADNALYKAKSFGRNCVKIAKCADIID